MSRQSVNNAVFTSLYNDTIFGILKATEVVPGISIQLIIGANVNASEY